jgi:hypothetical protein
MLFRRSKSSSNSSTDGRRNEILLQRNNRFLKNIEFSAAIQLFRSITGTNFVKGLIDNCLVKTKD